MRKVTEAPGVERAMRGRADELLEVLRVVLLLQGAILVANTIEAALFAVAFNGGQTLSVLLTAVAAITVLVARSRLGASRAGRRPLFVLESFLLVSLGIDTALALFFTHQAVPVVSVLTRFVIPVSVIALLGRISAVSRASAPLEIAA